MESYSKTFNIKSFGRVWASAEINGYQCKIKICDRLKEIGIGEHTIVVNDLSVRSNYGVDLKFQVAAVEKSEIITFQHEFYNYDLCRRLKKLGGVWDAEAKAWILPSFVQDKVDELELKYNSQLVDVEITFERDDFAENEELRVCGYPVATATGRDSGAQVAKGVAVIKGKFGSGGSIKNWNTYVQRGTVIRMKLPVGVLKDCEYPYKTLNQK